MKVLRSRLAKLEAAHADRPIADDGTSRIALGDPRAVEIAIAYDRRAREERGGPPRLWHGLEDLKGLSAETLARMFQERVAALRAGRAA